MSKASEVQRPFSREEVIDRWRPFRLQTGMEALDFWEGKHETDSSIRASVAVDSEKGKWTGKRRVVDVEREIVGISGRWKKNFEVGGFRVDG
jgi:hypothetical protein